MVEAPLDARDTEDDCPTVPSPWLGATTAQMEPVPPPEASAPAPMMVSRSARRAAAFWAVAVLVLLLGGYAVIQGLGDAEPYARVSKPRAAAPGPPESEEG